METYNIFVTTSDVKGAGTDANVYVILYGEKEDSGKCFRLSPGAGFEPRSFICEMETYNIFVPRI